MHFLNRCPKIWSPQGITVVDCLQIALCIQPVKRNIQNMGLYFSYTHYEKNDILKGLTFININSLSKRNCLHQSVKFSNKLAEIV